MLDMLWGSVTGEVLAVGGVLLCTLASLVLGLSVACVYMYRNHYSKGFVLTLALLPTMVQIVIMLVNGNLGAGVAVAGAFSLIRFRSVPGSARDIGSIFFAMAIGLATGMGYILYAFLFLAVIGLATIALISVGFGNGQGDTRMLKITIPESLDYDGLFDDLFARYTRGAELDRVRTTNMGSLYELSYIVRMRSQPAPKQFIDELRCRNGNLNIVLGRVSTQSDEL